MERVAPTIDDNVEVLTYWVGPVHAGKEELGMYGPARTHSVKLK